MNAISYTITPSAHVFSASVPVTVQPEPYNIGSYARLAIKRSKPTYIALSTVAAFAAATLAVGLNESLFRVTEYKSQTDVHEEPQALEVSQKFFEAYREIMSYRSLSDGWDGPGSLAPSAIDLSFAEMLLAALPEVTPAPEAGVTEDGYVEWYWKTDSGVATISFNGGKMIYYVRVKNQRLKGSLRFNGRSLPVELIDALKEL